MSERKKIKISQLVRTIKNDITIGFLVGLIVPFVALIVEFLKSDLAITFGNIGFIHQNRPSLYLLDLIPFVVAGITYYYIRIREEDKNLFEEEIAQRDEDINRNATFAKEIGEGNYKAELAITDENDILGKSLLVMRDNLLDNNKKEEEESWIAKGKDIISNILRIHNNIDVLAYEVVVNLIEYIGAIQGAFYLFDEEDETLTNLATYAYNRKKYLKQEFKIGQGLIGQCAFEKDIIYRTEIPEDYVTVSSGILGDKKPSSLLIVPLIADEKLQGVIEFATLQDKIPPLTVQFLKELGEIIARTMFNLRVNQKTERLLAEAQQMTEELRENEEQLRQSAEEMRATHEELEKSNTALETKVQEVENAQKRQHSLLENASEIISIYDEKLKLVYISPSVTGILGYTTEEMMRGKDMDRLTRKGENSLRNMFQQLLDNPTESYTIEYTYMIKDGKKIYMESTGRNLLNNPAIKGIILNSRDITERKRAEKEERMKSKMQALSENSLDAIMRLNTGGQFFYVNPVTSTYLGVDSKELLNKTIKDFDLQENLIEFYENTIKDIKKTNKKTNEEITLHTDELGERIVNIDAIPEFNENELETILFVFHDITEAKRIELEIADKNRKLGDSINYAQRIQTSILPDNKTIQEYLPKSFIYYKPRDVVSGDFPWFFKKDKYLNIAAVDCTGHGVPGALLSFIGYFILNNVVDHDAELEASVILDQLHYGVRSALKQDRIDADARDGMDIAFCKIDLENNKLQYAGAHRPLYMLREGELIEYKGDRKAIGGIPHRKKPEKPFTNYKIDIQKGDKVFFFSDGLPDQLGGPENKKYSPRKIRETIIENEQFSMPQYSNYFSRDFSEWMADAKQIDDVLLIGIEF
jgi:PAS domain S-box-containing protein